MSDKEQRCAIKFCFRLGHNATETFAELQQAYGDSVLSRAQVFQWSKAFSEGRESNEDEPLRYKGLQFQKPLKISLESGILCVQIVA
ncbi:HTH_48 domain-containing protein [Trichonephila clavipes]|nr:HTH_48 domain-containing protein [Trichonephila clavipes]